MAEPATTASAEPIPSRDEAPYRVSAIERVTPSIVEVWLRPLGKPMAFLPGEYVLLEDSDRHVPPRSYSIANAPRPDGEISLLVTRVAEGATSSWVHDRLRAGDEVILTGPYGTFVADPSCTSPCLYLAAGSGLAPIRALIEASLKATAQSLTLVLSARTQADLLDRDRLLGWQAEQPQFRFIATLTRAAGGGPRRRVPDLLPDICPRLVDHAVFIAGSPGFVLACAAAAETLGAARERTHTEPFFVEPQPWSAAPPTSEQGP
jgi:CDP-4-dehydro-6-deoxyglucose reductase, E3